ncbi:MAG: hypothetical protein ACK4HV_00660 [Parachlamydiaceae bacterium]
MGVDCKNCLISDKVPGVVIDENQICNFCKENSTTVAIEASQRQAYEKDLESTLKEVKNRKGYHALVCLSGGKDSLYLLYKLKIEYGLNVLAFTTDVNLPEIAWKNIRTTVKKLHIDHEIYRPDPAFYNKLFAYLLKNQEERGAVYTVSYVYAPLFEGDAIRLAIQKNIPLIFAGYSPGQPEKERMQYAFSKMLIEKTDWTPPALKKCGDFSEEELSRFYNPLNETIKDEFPRYLAPFHAWKYDQDEIMKRVYELGLVEKKSYASPILSNYPINWLLMYSDLKHFGYNPYLPEFAKLIREGKASRLYWKFAQPIVNFMIRNKVFLGKEVLKQQKILKLNDEDLKITCPRGAYDPIIL